MPVYVDRMEAPFGRMVMCHMVADTVNELHEMADKIGLSRRWFQLSKLGMAHYDISKSKKMEAIRCGAIEIDSRKLYELYRKQRKDAHPG